MIHREGRLPLFITLILLIFLYSAIQIIWTSDELIKQLYLGFAIVIYLLVLQFFRNPKRHTISNAGDIIAPADGKVVLIEELEETEYLNDKRKMISIFMSPLNVHVNRVPITGKVTYTKYHPGKYLVAWHPKSSTLNERTTVVMQNDTTGPVLFRQIAGAVARRIAIYCKIGEQYNAGQEFGFIRFGSRMDIFLPLEAEICVDIGDKPIGGETIIAKIKSN
ncbi:MAG: Phosphatidylserine decarboxylase proenzyme [Owenweeksia sp. TMED14]|nr:MAG: Phosphatidylserine decarboxylase proenzyme [Owenweeksia sp. TMED14]|tara:strand:- start:7051 stop:7713 length:663 start_codon:yes stop_codon:yes gene_type:complete